MYLSSRYILIKWKNFLGCADTHLWSQHLGGGSRHISVSSRPVCRVSSRTARAAQRNPVSKHQNEKFIVKMSGMCLQGLPSLMVIFMTIDPFLEMYSK